MPASIRSPRRESKPRRQVLWLITAALCAALCTCEREPKPTRAKGTSREQQQDSGSPSQDAAAQALGPQQIFELQFRYLRTRDARSLWKLFSGNVKQECERARDAVRNGEFGDPKLAPELGKLSPAEFCAFLSEKDRGQFRTPPVNAVEQPSPDTAIVYYGRDYKQRLQRVAGEWKIDEYLAVLAINIPVPRDAGVTKVPLPSGNAH